MKTLKLETSADILEGKDFNSLEDFWMNEYFLKEQFGRDPEGGVDWDGVECFLGSVSTLGFDTNDEYGEDCSNGFWQALLPGNGGKIELAPMIVGIKERTSKNYS